MVEFLLCDLTVKKAKMNIKNNHIWKTFTRRRHLEPLPRRRRGCVFEEKRRPLRCEKSVCVNPFDVTSGGEKKGNNRRISSVLKCASYA